MRKLLLNVLLLLTMAIGAVAQTTTLFSEDFEGGTMPDGWTTDGSGTWSVATGDYSSSTGAGNGTYNAKITHGTTGNVTKLITPEIDLSSVAAAELSFMHVQRSWAGDYDYLKVYYRASSEDAWAEIASYTSAYTAWTTEEGIALSNLSGTYQLAFEMTDNYGYGVGVDYVQITTPPTCVRPSALEVSDVTAHTATLSWTAGASETAWQICLDNDEDNLIDVTTNPYTLTGLTAEHNYSVKVRANCGADDVSTWTSASFTTLVSCLVPTNMEFSDIATTTATVSWTAGASETLWNLQYKKSSDSEWTEVNGLTSTTYTLSTLVPSTMYNVRVQADCEVESTSQWLTGTFTTVYGIPFLEEFGTSIPANWALYTGLLSSVMEGTSLSSSSYGWSFGTNNGVFDNHARVNIYGTSSNKWLVTPAIMMDANVRLTFDLALTAFSGNGAAATTGTDDKFVVLVSTDNGATWTILRQYDNAGSEYVYNNIPTAGEEVAIDLSSYTTGSVIIAFYGESTESNADNNLHIDNVRLDYIPNCVRPTALAVSNITTTAATLTWTAGANETAWQICIGGDEDNLIDVEGTPTYDLSELTSATTYQVKVRANCGGSNGVSEWTSEIEFTTAFCATEDMCEISYVLTDSYGDGWNGGAGINVVDAGTSVVIATLTLSSGSSTSGTLSVCNGRDLDFVWISGSFDSECSYTINDVNNDEIFSGSGAMTAPVSYTVNCTQATCVRPDALAVSNVTTTAATLTWTAGADETAWQICIGGDEENLIDVTETPTFDLSGLTAATTYQVKVRANCGGSDGVSSWTSEVEFTTVICEAEDQCQISYELTDPGNYGYGWMGAEINVYDAETGILLATWALESGETSANGTLSVCNGRQITFEWISGAYDDYVTAYAVYDVAGDEIFSGTGSMASDVDYTVNCSACGRPTNVQVSNVGPTSANLVWTAADGQTAWQVCFNNDEENIVDVTTTTYEMTGLTAETDYTVKVRTNCGADQSAWVEVNFTTTDNCPVPAELAATTTSTTANLSWAGFNDSYVVRYRTVNAVINEGFENGIPATWTTIDADADGNNWLTLSEIPTTYTAYSQTPNWAHSGSDAASSPSYANGVGSFDSNHWLITPQIDLGSVLNFYVRSTDASYFDSYEVLLSTTGTSTEDFTVTLKTMASAPNEWEEVSVDLSDYADQQGYIAVHHVSSNMYFLVVDDFSMYTYGEWVEVNATDASVALSNLTPETTYEFQVKGVCGENETAWSESATFVTEPSSIVPNTYTITLTVGEHGTVTATDEDDNDIAIENGVITVNEDEDVYLVITPDANYQIDQLIVDGTPVELEADDLAGFAYPMLAIGENHVVSVTFSNLNNIETSATSMAVYPNPNNGMFSIDFSNIEGEATYQLIDARGAVVETREINVTNGETKTFNHTLTAGTYFVRIINGDKVYVEQIVVE